MAKLLPPRVQCEEMFSDPPVFLFPGELEYIARAGDTRRLEFATGRHCARRALARLGCAPEALLADSSRAPLWPRGVVGSITHCSGYRAAAVARSDSMVSIGIDAEVHRPLPEGVAKLVTVANEPAMLNRLARQKPEIAWDAVLFSAKESIFKAWFPLALEWLDFTQCLVTIDAETGSFSGRFLIPGPCVRGFRLPDFTGRWEVSRTLDTEHVLTAVAVD